MMIAASVAIIVSAMAVFGRLVLGPTVPDRLVAANTLGVMFFTLIVLLAGIFRTDSFLDVALVYAVLQFADVLIMAKYLNRPGSEAPR